MSKRKRSSSSSSSSSEDSVADQIPKTTSADSKFSWANHEQTLKDIVSKHKLWEPNGDQSVEIATIMQNKYKILNVDAEKVRQRFRTKTFTKWIEAQKRKEKKEKKSTKSKSSRSKRKKLEQSESTDYSDSGSDSEEFESESKQITPLSSSENKFSSDSYLRTVNWRSVPDQFKLMQATVLHSKTAYYILYRTDLASIIYPHVQVIPDPMLMLEVRIDPIYAEEMNLTQAWKDAEIRMPRSSESSKLIAVPLPSDALLGSSSVARHDYDTEYGRLFELVVPRFISSTFTLSPPNSQLKQQERAVTSLPLHKKDSTNQESR